MTESIAWVEQIKTEASKLTRAVLDKLVATDRSGFRNLSADDRRQVGQAVVNEVVGAMLRLGTFLTTGGSESVAADFDGHTIKGGKPIKVNLLVAPTPGNVQRLGENAGRHVTLAFIDHEAYIQARDALLKAVVRDQMDWLKVDDEELFPPVAAQSEDEEDMSEAEPGTPLAPTSLEAGEDWEGDDLEQAPTTLLDSPDAHSGRGARPAADFSEVQ